MGAQLDIFRDAPEGTLAAMGPLRALRRIAASEATPGHGRMFGGCVASLPGEHRPGSLRAWRRYCHAYSKLLRMVHKKEWR